MKIRVKLYGTLSRLFPDYRTATGMEIEVPPGMSVKNLLDRLRICENQGGVAVVDGRVLKMEEEIPPGVEVRVFQSVRGG
jgi:sulfur carrier protein ThiS